MSDEKCLVKNIWRNLSANIVREKCREKLVDAESYAKFVLLKNLAKLVRLPSFYPYFPIAKNKMPLDKNENDS